MVFLVALFILLFLILLLSMPLIVEARARIGLRGAVVHARVYVMGLVPVPLRFRINLLCAPYFTLRFGKKRASLLRRKPNGAEGITEGLRIRNLRVSVTLGVRDDPARSIWCAGVCGVLLSMLIPRVSETGTVRVRAAKDAVLRFSVQGSAVLLPFDALRGIWRARRIARAKAADNSVKPKEKRTDYASC